MGVVPRKFRQQGPHDLARRVGGIAHAEENPHRAAVVLLEPTAQAILGVGIGAFEGFEDGDAGSKRGRRHAPMQGERQSGEPWPDIDEMTEHGQQT